MLRPKDHHSMKEYHLYIYIYIGPKSPYYWNPRKLGMYCEFSKNDILLMQQLKILVASRIKTVLWNEWFSRISIYGYFEPIGGYPFMLWWYLGLSKTFYLNLFQHTVKHPKNCLKKVHKITQKNAQKIIPKTCPNQIWTIFHS